MINAAEEHGSARTADFGALHTSVFSDDLLRALLMSMWDEAQAGSPSGRLLGDSLWLALSATFLARRDGQENPSLPACDRRLKRAMNWLEDKLECDVGLSEIAAMLGLSQSHLYSLFRNEFGYGPNRWLREKRLEHACRPLQDTGLGHTEIAMNCGFSSAQHFATTFRNAKGVTPTSYRLDRSR